MHDSHFHLLTLHHVSVTCNKVQKNRKLSFGNENKALPILGNVNNQINISSHLELWQGHWIILVPAAILDFCQGHWIKFVTNINQRSFISNFIKNVPLFSNGKIKVYTLIHKYTDVLPWQQSMVTFNNICLYLDSCSVKRNYFLNQHLVYHHKKSLETDDLFSVINDLWQQDLTNYYPLTCTQIQVKTVLLYSRHKHMVE